MASAFILTVSDCIKYTIVSSFNTEAFSLRIHVLTMKSGFLSSNGTEQSDKFVCEHTVSMGLKMVPFAPSVMFRVVSILLCIINGLLCPITVTGNLLVFAAVLRKTDLRTVANTSILCLAFTDLLVGLFVQPCYLVYQASKLAAGPHDFPCVQLLIYSFLGVICICMSFLTLILISLERYMAVFHPYRYIEKVNTKRVIALAVTSWCVSITVLLVVRFLFGINSNQETGVISLIIVTNFVVTSFVYFRIFRLVKQCNAQVNVQMSHNTSTSGSPPTQMQSNSNEAKASKTVAFIAGTLFLCFAPTLCATIVDQAGVARKDLLYHVIYPIAETVVLLNSCINPVIYVWRCQGIRQSLFQLTQTCKR